MRVSAINVKKNNNGISETSYTNGIQRTYLNKNTEIDSISFTGNKEKTKDFKIGLSLSELKRRTSDNTFRNIDLLGVDSPEFAQLAEGDKKATAHLTKAAYILDDVYQKQDNELNIPFRENLKQKALNGDKKAELALELYNGQKGIISYDQESKAVVLLKGEKTPPGRALWPVGMHADEIKQILNKMLDENKVEEVRNILSLRTVVKKDGDRLKAVDYTEEYKAEFQKAADEIEKAAETSTNPDFNEFLKLQAEALRKNDNQIDAKADIKWASLQDTPLEFTVIRESYDETITKTLSSDKTFAERLKSLGIKAYSKDFLGARVGIVNRAGTKELYEMKDMLPVMVKNAPFNTEYKPSFLSNKGGKIQQNMVDVDIIAVSGDAGKYRAGILMAENLPNDDKLALKMGGGKRNVYHRQVRAKSDPQKDIENAKKFVGPELYEYYTNDAYHWHVEIHENSHAAVGPAREETHLGPKFASVLEESKADLGIDIIKEFERMGKYSEKQKKQIYTTYAINLARQLKSKPNIEQTYRVRALMELQHYISEGAITVEKKRIGLSGLFHPTGVMHIDFDKMQTATRKMLEQIVRIQIDDKAEAAEKFVNEKFVWSKDVELLSRVLRQTNKVLNGTVNAPLAEHLLKTLR